MALAIMVAALRNTSGQFATINLLRKAETVMCPATMTDMFRVVLGQGVVLEQRRIVVKQRKRFGFDLRISIRARGV